MKPKSWNQKLKSCSEVSARAQAVIISQYFQHISWHRIYLNNNISGVTVYLSFSKDVLNYMFIFKNFKHFEKSAKFRKCSALMSIYIQSIYKTDISPRPSVRHVFTVQRSWALTTDGRGRRFLQNTVFIVVIMSLVYNPLQNTKRFAFHILLQVQLLFPSCFLYHYLHFEKFSKRCVSINWSEIIWIWGEHVYVSLKCVCLTFTGSFGSRKPKKLPPVRKYFSFNRCYTSSQLLIQW